MNPSLPIGPEIPHIPPTQWNLPDRPSSLLKEKAHAIAMQAIQVPKSRDAFNPANRIAYHKEIGRWLEKVHSLCTDILKARKENDLNSLQIDFNYIQERFNSINLEIVSQTKTADATKEDESSRMREEITKLLAVVQFDLHAVHHASDFSMTYDYLEQRIKEWNFVAEHPSYREGECLREKPYDSLIRYTQLEKTFAEIKEKLPQSLLEETTSDLNRIRQSFTHSVLPALKTKLAEAKKNYQQAAENLKKTGLSNRWKQDTAASIIQDFMKYQEALAEMRYQEQAISAALAEIPQSEKITSKVLSQLLAASAIPGKNIKAAEEDFIRRLKALSDGKVQVKALNDGEELPKEEEQVKAWTKGENEAIQLLSKFPIPTGNSSEFEKTRAFFHCIHELVGEQAFDPFFNRIVKTLQKFDQSNQPPTAREHYQQAFEIQYTLDAEKFRDLLKQEEDALAADLEKGPSGWKQKGLGMFFLFLHAGAAAHNFVQMGREAASLPGRADRLQQELIALAGKKAEREAAFIGVMLSDKYEDLKTMSAADLQRITKRFPDDVRETLEPFRLGASKPSSEEIFAIHQQYVLKHTNPSFKEQISNWYTQFTTNQEDKMRSQETVKVESNEAAGYETPAPEVGLKLGGHLIEALKKKDGAAIIELVKIADLNVKNQNGDTPLHLAVSSPFILEQMIARGADVNAVNKEGETPLHLALKTNFRSALLLLKAEADPNVKDLKGNTPLGIVLNSVFLNDKLVIKVITKLLEAGADPNEKGILFSFATHLEASPLEIAIIKNNLPAVQVLIDHGVDFHSADSDGNPPLVYAQGKEVARALLKAGASTETPNGDSILSIAIAAKRWGLSQALLDKKSPSTVPSLSEIKTLVAQAPMDCIQAFVRRFKMNRYLEIFNPSNLVRLGRVELLSSSLDKGLDINYSDENGMTALHWAYLLNLPDLPQFLTTRGANPEATNRFGLQPAALIPNEETLGNQVTASVKQYDQKIFPLEILEKLKQKVINRGISTSSLNSALPLLPIPSNVSLELAELIAPTAILKTESDLIVRRTIPAKTGALRQRLGALTGKYLDQLLLEHPISDIKGFFVPETIIRHNKKVAVPIPVSVTRFVPWSVDMGESMFQQFAEGEWIKLLVLDLILGNTDRHAFNYRVQTTINEGGELLRRIIPIDHDLTLPDLRSQSEYRWGALSSVSEEPLSEEWKNFILGIDPDTLWNEYEREATAYKTTYAVYTKGETGINDDVYLNFQARIKVLQEGARLGWSPKKIGELFFKKHEMVGNVLVEYQMRFETFFYRDDLSLTREERKAQVFANIMRFFKPK